ncbi:unnamed protein product [Phytophthora fragariaefolia]|uniref:Unnamed protein product n=1 Tax=Phytophthora fragariaefolia TaxID=1490495 RepID=A0A9W6TQB0_9STRA|nr:unnamed protein product [Phytophthora fragariaefolia]
MASGQRKLKLPCSGAVATSTTTTAETATAPPETTDPATPPPETADPATSPPETTDPVTPPPETTDPATPPPETTDPATPPLETTDPATPPPETTDPATPPPETTDPATPPPETTDPATPPPETTDPATPPPETTDPATPPPETTDPATPPPETTKAATTPPKTTTAATTVPVTIAPTTAPSSTETPAAASTKAPSTTTTAPAEATTDPVVEHYNSSTLPPGVDSSMLNGSELVTVEVTETTQEDGTSSYSYVVITRMGNTLQTIVLSPSAASAAGSSQSNTNNSAKASSSLGIGTIVAIIVVSLVFMLVSFAFFIVQRRRSKNRPSNISSDDVLDSPVVGKQVWLLEQGQSLADTEYAEMTRTTANSRSTGSSVPIYSHHRGTLWEDPVIQASRIPFDRIELGTVIGRGAFGEVYCGRYRGQDVAIKMLVPEKRKDMAHIQALLSEVRLMATMEHPHIVPFVGVAWESLSDLCCVSEYMPGGDLRTLLKEYLDDGIPQGMDAIKMQIAYEVAYALTYLHSFVPVVLHRDLKSRNILLTESLHAKITDFGASRIRSDATMTSNVGSSLWMAPEVMIGGHYDEKADVFSLGVVISELDTHELPYSHAKEGNSGNGRSLPDAAVLQMVSMGKLRVRFSSFMHPDMVSFVERCVSVDPQERPTAAEVLYHLQMATKNRQC